MIIFPICFGEIFHFNEICWTEFQMKTIMSQRMYHWYQLHLLLMKITVEQSKLLYVVSYVNLINFTAMDSFYLIQTVMYQTKERIRFIFHTPRENETIYPKSTSNKYIFKKGLCFTEKPTKFVCNHKTLSPNVRA